jgi:serine/threonine protein kinase
MDDKDLAGALRHCADEGKQLALVRVSTIAVNLFDTRRHVLFLAKDADRVARFQREAKLLASLNHPNLLLSTGWRNLPELISSSLSWWEATRLLIG